MQFAIITLIGIINFTYGWNPGNPTVNWRKAGSESINPVAEIPGISSVPALNNALANRDRSKITKITLTSGDFIFNGESLILDSNVIILGQGATNTRLLFNVGGDSSHYTSVKVIGNWVGSEIAIDSGYPECISFKSDYLVLEDASTINAGDYINLYVTNTDIWGRDHSQYNTFIGQMLKVLSKNGNTIYLDDSLHLDFRNFPNQNGDWEDLNPRIQKIRPAHHVGIENLYIGPQDTNAANGTHIRFHLAANCRVSNIESYMPTWNHVSIGKSINVTVEGSYFHYGNKVYGGGQAYGILISNTATNCLVENNMFYHLRHAICFAGGANGNVAGYNASVETVFQDDNHTIPPTLGLPCSDYYFHGRYPFANLVEGNIGHFIQFENTWGVNGPYNMIFKNAIIKSNKSFGLEIKNGHPYQNVIGNYITYRLNWLLQSYQGYFINSTDIYQYLNCDKGEYWDAGYWIWQWANTSWHNLWYPDQSGSDNDLNFSYYRLSDPEGWFGDWPEFTARDDLKSSQGAYVNWRNDNYNAELFKYVKLLNVDETSGDSLSEGYFSLYRKNYSAWYDNIPSTGQVRLDSSENIVDVKSHQDVIQSKKHHMWDNDRQKHLLQSFNHNVNIDSKIRSMYLVQQTASATWTEPVKVYLKDPWYVSDPELLTQPETYREISAGVSFDVFIGEGGPNASNLEYPYYSVRAPKFCATTNAVYEFSHWSSPNGKATFDPNNVDNYAGCGVRFDQDGAVVKPNYMAVNNQTNYTFMIQSNETLTIPANANIQCADGFTIDVQPYGTLIADGSSGQIILSGDCMATTLNDPVFDEVAGIYGVPSSEMNKLISVSVNGNVQLRNAKIEGYHVGLYVEADHFLTLNNVEIADCNIGIYVDSNAGLSTLEIDSCHIHHCDIGVYFHPEVYDENVLIHHSLFHDIDCYGLFVYYGNGSSAQSVNFLDHPINLLVDFCSFIDCGIDDSYNSDYRGGVLICNNSVWDYYFYGQINAYIRNSIFYNAPFYSNDDEEDYIELNGVKNIYYLSGYDWPDALGVAYSVNPYFVDYGSGDFRISDNSYAVDHGTFANPLSGIFPNYSYTTDPDGTAPDIGAIYFPQVTISGGDFSGDIASYGKVTVVGNINLTGNVFVPEPVEMVISAGRSVSAASDKSINVYGKLVVNGNSQSPVDFNNVSINVGMDGNADIEYANITSAGLQVSYGKVNLSHCNISNSDNNTDGLCALYLNPTSSIENCSFVNNSRYGAYMMGGITWLEDCEISGHNNCSGLRLANYNGVLQDNWITDNYDGIAFISGNANLNGGYYSEDQVTGLGSVNEAILNNIIANNTRYGISISSAATPIIGTANYWEPDGEIWFGGSNAFFAAGGDYYIYSANSGTVYARSNFWDQEEYIEDDLIDGNINVSPCYYIDASLSKPTGGTKPVTEQKPKYRPTHRDLLIIKTDSLLIRKEYDKAVKEYQRIIEIYPDDQIARTALNRIIYIFENLEQTERELEYLENLQTADKDMFIGMLAYDLSSHVYLKNRNFERAFAINEEVAQSYSAISENEFAAEALYENLLLYEFIAMDSLSSGSLAKISSGSAQAKVSEYLDRILKEYPETGAAKMLREQYGIPEPSIPVELPTEYALKSCYPNPFNPVTNISFDLPEKARISIVIYDLVGRKIWELPDNNLSKPAGSYTYQWNGCNRTGAQVASGIYFVRMHTDLYSKIGKVMLIK